MRTLRNFLSKAVAVIRITTTCGWILLRRRFSRHPRG